MVWHRWASASGKPTLENELHGVDPASPVVNSYLWQQTQGFLQRLPNRPGKTSYKIDWKITDPQAFAVYDRFVGAKGSGSKGAKSLQQQYNAKGLKGGTAPQGYAQGYELWNAFNLSRTLNNPHPKKVKS